MTNCCGGKLDNQTRGLRHGLVYGLDAVAHGEFVHDFLLHLIEIHLPGIISLSHRDFHHAVSLHIGREVEDVLQRGVNKQQQCLREDKTAGHCIYKQIQW